MKQIQSQTKTVSFLWSFDEDGLTSSFDTFLFPPGSKPRMISFTPVEPLIGTTLTGVDLTLKTDPDNNVLFTANADKIMNGNYSTQPPEGTFWIDDKQESIVLEITIAGGSTLTAGKILFTVDFEVYPIFVQTL